MTANLEQAGLKVVRYRNDSGETVPAYGIIKITEFVTENGFYLAKGDKPDTWGSQYSHYVNGPLDIADGDVGECYVPNGPVWAKYDTGSTPLVGQSWGPTNNSWQLSQHVGGFEVLSATGVDGYLLVTQKPMLWFLGKTDASHAKSATGTVSIYSGATVGSETDTTVNKTGVYNRFADLASGKWVHCRWIKDDDFEFDAGEC